MTLNPNRYKRFPDIQVEPIIKILFADLLEIGIGKFLLSEKFKFILLKEDLDDIWNKLEEYVDERIDDPMIITSGYTERVEEKLKYLINHIYKKEPEDYFLYFISNLLEEFSKWSDTYISLQNIKYTLLGFGFTEEDIDISFFFDKGIQIKKVRSRFKSLIPSFRTRLTIEFAIVLIGIVLIIMEIFGIFPEEIKYITGILSRIGSTTAFIILIVEIKKKK